MGMPSSMMRAQPKLPPMILAQFAFLKGTLQSELPSRVSCSYSLSSLPFCVFCLKEEDEKICLPQVPQFTVDLIPTLHIPLIAAKIAKKNKTFYEEKNKKHFDLSQKAKKRMKKGNL